MKVLQILPELNVGGVETGTVDFAKYLIERGHKAVVVSRGGLLVEDLEKSGATHYSLPVHKKNIFTMIKCVKKLRQIILQEKMDIVHARSRVPGWVAYFACRQTPAKFITTCHGYYSNRIFSSVMGWGKYVIVPSSIIGRHMIETYKVAAESIRCIPRSVDLKRFNVKKTETKGKSSYTIAIVGRLTPLKGHKYFLKAMARVVRIMPFVKILIIGDAPAKKPVYREELEVLTRRLGLSDFVEFLGNRKDVPQLLAESDLLVMSSIRPESFGRVILEAQAIGIPVVATKVGGVVEIIDDRKTGMLVLPKDPDGMAKAVLSVLKDKKFAKELVVNAKVKLKEKFTLDHMAGQTMDVYLELLDSLNILVIKMSSIGDVILITASLKALRRKFPKAKIFCLVGKESRQVLQRCSYVDEVIVMDIKGKDKGLWKMIRFAKKLRRNHFDMIIDFQNNNRSHFLTALSFARNSYGYKRGKLGFVIKNPVKDPETNISPVEHQFQVLKLMGIDYKKEVMLELSPTEKDRKYIEKFLNSEWVAKNMKVVGINISASEKWRTKNWPIENIARLCDQLASENIRALITGTEGDKEQARNILGQVKTKPANFVGKTSIMELAALIKRCDVFITPDSAPMHIAAAVKTPFIAFFGPTSSRRHLPPAKSYAVFERDLECAPCYSPHCNIFTHVCMKDVKVEEVMNRVRSFLKEK
ncbi:MAG: glycosyltransferase [Candidatus Omnitrophica bacterium]|nr:glycosyltransferase [Candidatus Omnitrophota bacterium]